MPDTPPSAEHHGLRPVFFKLLLVFLATLAVMTVFESAKQFFLEDIGTRESHGITILFSSIVAAIVAFWIIRRESMIGHLLLAEFQGKKDAQSRNVLLSHTLESISECVSITDMQDTILHVNKKFLETYGYSEDEVLGKSIAMLRSDRNDPQVTREILPATIGGGWHGELWNCRKDGSAFKIYLSSSPVFDDKGQPIALVGVAMDLSKRERAQQALQESEKRFQSIIANAHAGYFFINDKGLYQQVNAAWLQLHKYKSPNDIIGQHFSITHAEVEKAKQIFGQAMDGQFLPSFEFSRRCKDGSSGHTTASISSVYREGRIIGLEGFIIDTTEYRRAELARQESERRLNELLQTVNLLAVMQDLEGNITFCNNFLCKMTGWSQEELLGKNWFDIFIEESERKNLSEKWKFSLTSAAIPPHHENQILARNGDRILVEWDNTLLRDPSGAFVGSASIGRDVTHHRALEERLRQAEKLESVGRLAGGIAHDFNNLLTVINGYSEFLLDRVESTDPIRSGLEDIRRAGEKAAVLTRQLLVFSRKQVFQRKALDLNAVVTEAEKMLGRLIGEDIELAIALEPQLNTIHADADQVHQVLMNLAANARDAMPSGGKLKIHTHNAKFDHPVADEREEIPAGQYVLLSVSDTGMGLSHDARLHLFEPFFTTKDQGKGTGLGLPTVYGIIQQSGGHILVESVAGRGTTFKIFFPTINTPLAIAEEEPENKKEILGTESILLVEDQKEVRQLALSVLKSGGYRVIEAASGDEALQLCRNRSGRIDLVITDMVMPGMSGTELVERLKAFYPTTPVLFMSGFSRDSSVESAAAESSWFFIPKPFAIQAFKLKVREILDQNKAKRRILVADDEPAIRHLLKEILERSDFEVVEAADGKAALREIRSQPIDLVLTDLVMPEKEGLETIPIIRREFPAIKIIAMSGAFGGEFLNPAKLLGAHATLLKPISPSTVLEAVKKVLK
jgi:PAS domain S-box-containing protein